MRVEMTFETTLKAQTIDHLMAVHCHRATDANYKHLEISDEGAVKRVTILFADEHDRNRFHLAFSALGGKVTQPQSRKATRTPLLTTFMRSLGLS